MKPHICIVNGRWTWDYYGKAQASLGTLRELVRMNVAAAIFCNRANQEGAPL